jgi:hypothetical protein
MPRELEGVELGQRAAGSLLLENETVTDQRQIWVKYIATVAGWRWMLL